MLGPPGPLQKGGLERSVTPFSGYETRERGRIEDKPFAARRVREPMDSKRATGIRLGQHPGLESDIAAFPKGADKRHSSAVWDVRKLISTSHRAQSARSPEA
jgi:hypothetical protein